MKFSVIALATVVSATVVERDFAPYGKVLDAVGQNIQKLDTAVTGFNGDKQSLLDAAAALIKSLSDGKTTVDGLDKLTEVDAASLVQPVNDLNDKGNKLVTDLKAKRDTVSKAGECATVRKSVGDINTNSQALISAVVAKVPAGFQDLAKSLAGKLTTTLNQAQDDFSEANCKDSTGGGSSSAAPSSTAPTGSPSSAAPTPTGTLGPTTQAPPASSGPTKPTTTPPVTAGASAFAPAGALALAIAALAL